jgi:hypothetical protein
MDDWCEITVSRRDGKVTYKNSFATSRESILQTFVKAVMVERCYWALIEITTK